MIRVVWHEYPASFSLPEFVLGGSALSDMAQPHLELKEKLSDIGLDQYYDTLVNSGFSTWESVLRLSEDDFDALDFKRGHRRRLQRRIATDDGHALADPLPPRAESSTNRNSMPSLSTDEWSSSGQEQWNGKDYGHCLGTDDDRPTQGHYSDPFGSTANMGIWSFEQNLDIEDQSSKVMDRGDGKGHGYQAGSESGNNYSFEDAGFCGEKDSAVLPGRSGSGMYAEDGVHSGDLLTMSSGFPQGEDKQEASADMMRQFIDY